MGIILNRASYVSKRPFSLNDINMKIKSGKVNAIIGNGKTTLLELVIGLKKNTSGEITYDGKLLKNTKDFLNKIAYVVESPETQFIYKTVLKEFERINKSISDIIESLAYVGLKEDILKQSPQSLSNGEKRKVGLALAIVKNAEVIIIDEPTLGLDYNSKKAVTKVLKDLKKADKTIIITSNDIEFIHMVSDHIFVLANGQIIFEGDKYKVFKEEDILASYGIDVPNVIKFSNVAQKEKGIKLGYRDEINDLIKDIYRNAK